MNKKAKLFLSHQLPGNDQFCVIRNNEVPLFDDKATQISIFFEFYAASNHFIETQQNTSSILIFTIFACHECHFFKCVFAATDFSTILPT